MGRKGWFHQVWPRECRKTGRKGAAGKKSPPAADQSGDCPGEPPGRARLARAGAYHDWHEAHGELAILCGGCFASERARGLDRNRRMAWVADSFAGLPPPDPGKYPADAEDKHHTITPLAVSLEEVRENFKRYSLLDDQVCFLKGWFKDTLPNAPLKRLAVVRLDGDMYESTMDGLTNLYPKLSVGGYLIVDDFGAVRGCRKAVEDFRLTHGITESIQQIDWGGVFWRREK